MNLDCKSGPYDRYGDRSRPPHLRGIWIWQVKINREYSEYFNRYLNTNDPSAGSPTETLLRLLLPLSDKVYTTYHCKSRDPFIASIWIIHRITQSVGATGGVYKGQGRNQHELMTRTY